MARSIPVIYNQLLTAKNAQSNLSNLNSTSQVSKWNLWLWIIAVGQSILEQLQDANIAQMETNISNTPALTAQWIAQMCKNFQYSVSSPQTLQLTVTDTFPYVSISYPVINPFLCPVAQCSVTSNNNGQIIIKVATLSGSPPALGPLDGTAGSTSGATCMALQSYLNTILPPNIHYVLINDNPDRLYIEANVFFNASYSGVVQVNMNSAINAYLAGIPFNGTVTVSALEEAMLAVPGVNDVVLNNVFWRQAIQTGLTGGPPPSNSFYSAQLLVTGSMVRSRNYQTYAGYVIAEDTTGYTPADAVTYIPS